MVVSYALRSATASGVRPGSSRRLWRACIASHTASQRLPPAKSLGHALRQTLSCMSIRGWARLDSPCAWGCHRRSRCSRSDRRGTRCVVRRAREEHSARHSVPALVHKHFDRTKPQCATRRDIAGSLVASPWTLPTATPGWQPISSMDRLVQPGRNNTPIRHGAVSAHRSM
jgi:hypothetical protein